MDQNRNKILLTGANSFVGSRLNRLLEEKYHHQVLCMAHTKMPAHGTDAWFKANLLDPETYESFLANVKTVIHLAQLNDVFAQGSDRFFERQQKLTENLIHSCLAFGVEELIFLSSLSATLRTPDPKVFSDEGSQSPWLPTAFAKSKYKEELLIKKAEAEGLKVLIIYAAPLVDQKEKEVNLHKKYSPYSRTHFHFDVNELNHCIIRALKSNWWGERLLLAKQRATEMQNSSSAEGRLSTSFTKLKAWLQTLFRSFSNNSKTETTFLQSQSFRLSCQKTLILLSALDT